jgi:uncharacterized protein (UPF0335 family)
MPSVQLANYLQARADGSSVEDAAELSGVGLGEAVLHEADIESGELELPEPRARAHTHTREGGPEKEKEMAIVNVAADELRLLIERIERLEEERKALADDKSDVFQEAKSRGFDTNAMKAVIKIRKLEPHVRQEKEAILAVYLSAVGLSPDEAAIALAA